MKFIILLFENQQIGYFPHTNWTINTCMNYPIFFGP